MQKLYYELVVSGLDKHGKRAIVHNVTGHCDKYAIMTEQLHLQKEIDEGKYDYLIKGDVEELIADIEVHDDNTYELLYLM